MALDPRYITGVELEDYFVDKSTGFPLSNGTVWFWQDNARTMPKLVYELTDSPPYNAPNSYTALPNPITLSSVGTFQDAGGNNIAVYYFPFDAFGNPQLYYIQVFDQFGTEQFTREAWPFPLGGSSPTTLTQSNISNQITNPQFAQVSFEAPTLTITIGSPTTVNVPIAPDWVLNVTTSASTSLTVTQTPITGATQYPNNPPYTLTVTPGANITALSLTQKLPHDPSIWSPQAGGVNGWVSASILLAPNSQVTIQYAPSVGAAQTLLTQNNLTGVYTQFSATVQLTPGNNTDNGNVGFVNINLVLLPNAPTTFSNVQVVSLQSNVTNVSYDQTTYNRQIDQSFNYYSPLLQYKPIPSYLIGWDFPLNPAQPLGPTVAAIASGANTSNYFWDQTIVFQTTTSGVSAAQGADGSLVLTSAAVAGTQLALVQYLEAYTANEMLTTYLSCMMKAKTNNAGGLPITISLWYTTGTLPSVSAATYQSLVATLNADGSVATKHNGSQPWVQIARSSIGGGAANSNASFTLANSASYILNGFNGWLDTSGGATTATYFAIVVGTGVLAHNSTLTIQSISCVPGEIPTIPAPLSPTNTLSNCQRYFQMSFATGQVPASNLGLGNNESYFVSGVSFAQSTTNTVSEDWETEMHAVPTTFTTYNPAAAGTGIYDVSTATACAIFAKVFTQRGYYVSFDQDAGAHQSGIFALQWTADSRLGL